MLETLVNDPFFYPLMTGHFVMSAVAIALAKSKGFDLLVWIPLAAIGGTFAVAIALFKPKRTVQ
ncbi:hypothetical protein [Oxynema aestuarii]|jgi:hypothetical protein|uniref:Uncharacterized protein n=1 Tax=Oxynema aestuarii AP17 TaxID=2064643 RepID=A0A6H1TX85_9CYAN|nr:hypothetical protein [Oxynema aestuarii]QIZ70816.1 hypothetical protein HCG48_09665 [Oxynema aestuarii AP17]RMH70665.1 MAG: hypothetical protein D6680_23015 [Cyanobacteria bacterium J007]